MSTTALAPMRPARSAAQTTTGKTAVALGPLNPSTPESTTVDTATAAATSASHSGSRAAPGDKRWIHARTNGPITRMPAKLASRSTAQSSRRVAHRPVDGVCGETERRRHECSRNRGADPDERVGEALASRTQPRSASPRTPRGRPRPPPPRAAAPHRSAALRGSPRPPHRPRRRWRATARRAAPPYMRRPARASSGTPSGTNPVSWRAGRGA